MSSVAVVLRGHLRTWNYCKHQMFSVLESEYQNIDWYMVTWRESVNDGRIQSLYEDFQSRNFMLNVIEESSSDYNAWSSMGRCCLEVADIILKKQYTTVVETRPDTYIHLEPDVHLPPVHPGCFYTTSYILSKGSQWEPGAEDWFMMFDAKTFHVFVQERLKNDEIPHLGLLRIAKQHNLDMMSLPFHRFYTDLVRPSVYEAGVVKGNHGALWMFEWDDAKKMQVLQDLNIALEDYYTKGVASLNKASCYV